MTGRRGTGRGVRGPVSGVRDDGDDDGRSSSPGNRTPDPGTPSLSKHQPVQAKSFQTLKELAAAVRACKACALSKTRKNAVPGEGSGKRGIVFVGEAPGAKEDQQGRPFVGQAGKMLGGLLKKNGILREEVFITNVVKCRPPKNRPPGRDEVAACRPYIDRQLELLKPRLVCPMGNSALRALVDPKANITKMHGRPVGIKGLRVMPLYHPAAVLYRRRLMSEMEKDFSELGRLAGLGRAECDGGAAPVATSAGGGQTAGEEE